jgi:glucose/arabinose dehydrogenase
MVKKRNWTKGGILFVLLSLLMSSTSTNFAAAQGTGPEMLDPHLGVRTVLTGLNLPTSMAFLGPNEFLVLEKDTGTVQHVLNGMIDHTVLDLAVNNARAWFAWHCSGP